MNIETMREIECTLDLDEFVSLLMYKIQSGKYIRDILLPTFKKQVINDLNGNRI